MGKTQHLAFLNFCRVDVAAARRLYEDLTKAGIPVWFDETSLLPGQQWQHVIMSAIPDSSTVLVLHSSRSVGRPGYVNAELLAALEELDKYPPDDIFVIPIRIDE